MPLPDSKGILISDPMLLNVKERELTAISLFSYFTADEISIIAPTLEIRSFAPRKRLLTLGHSGSGVYFLRYGLVKVCAPSFEGEEGRDSILNICGRGEVLGEMDAMAGNGHSANVITLEKSEFWWMSTSHFRACLSDHPKLNCNLNKILTERLQRLSAKDSARTTLSLEGRVARQILILARDHGTCTPAGILLPTRLAQRDLAALVGSTRERVNRVLAIFRRRGVLVSDAEGHLAIRDCEALSNYCLDCIDHALLLNKLCPGKELPES